MAKPGCVANRKNLVSLCAIIGLMLFVSSGHAAVDRVTTYKDENGWKLKKNGEDFYIKGMVWSYSPKGENYTYNLWAESDDFIKKVIDHDFGLMARAGITANRSFTLIPPQWVTYIYQEHGIMSLINPLMGRYGANIGGIWQPNTNYADELTRKVLKSDVLAVVNQYKAVPGVLMFAFGNESNYGLSWSSFDIENLPVGEQNREKAKFLYSLWGEVVTEGKRIAPDHLFTIVNGDIQYLDLIAEYVPDMDVLGTNVYRGISFGDLWKDVKAGFDRPIVFMEFGADAFNAKHFAEDQPAQASFLKGQWQEIYNQSYGNGGYGNAIGGFVFEWRDEWWKSPPSTERLDVHDRSATWSNGGYTYDFVEGQDNMNEEWFGIMQLGELDSEGVAQAEPRMAYEVLSEIWAMDPYSGGKEQVDAMIRNVDMDYLALKSEVRELKLAKQESDKFSLVGGSLRGMFIVDADDASIEEDGDDGLTSSNGQMAFVDFAFQPTSKLKGDFSVNILANVAQSDFEFMYGDRGDPYTVEVKETTQLGPDESGTVAIKRSDFEVNDNERIEIYDFQASYEAQDYDLLAFYHTPRYHWGYEGDFFGLLRETTDMAGEDIWNAKAPIGGEFIGKGEMEGLKVVAGPEIYWGANPKIMAKYEWGEESKFAFVLSEDISRTEDSTDATAPTTRQERQATLYAKTSLSNDMTLEMGGIIANLDRKGDDYTYRDGSKVREDKIDNEDALGIKAKLTYDMESSRAYLGVNYSGLVANGGDPLREFGTELPYSSLGNKQEIEGGIQFISGDYQFFPRFLYRENIVDANFPAREPTTMGSTLNQGLAARNQDDDPFAVLDNREATALEFFFTYDPTPATWFYAWDVDMIEDAPFALNIGLTATHYGSGTDAYEFFFEDTNSNVAFGEGLDEEDVWLLKSKMIFNPKRG